MRYRVRKFRAVLFNVCLRWWRQPEPLPGGRGAAVLLETPAQVYAVSIAQLFQDDSTAFGPDLLDRLCYVSGGRSLAIDGRVDLDREMTRVNDEIRAEYILQPRNT